MKMKKRIFALLPLFCLLLGACAAPTEHGSESTVAPALSEAGAPETRFLTRDALYDKLKGAWAGQMAGVVLGAKQEFWYQGTMMLDDQVEDFSALNINDAFWQDDLYVEITYVEQMRKTGYNSTLKQMADAFKDSAYPLDHANKIGRENLQNGIEAPDSGSYLYNLHCDDLDWQINADFVGQLYPGAPDKAAARAFELGHITNYGDGVYGGVFVAALNAAAYTASGIDEIIAAGCGAIPDGTKFKTILNDVLGCYRQGLSWRECWQEIQTKWGDDDRCPWYGYGPANIDAKLNAAYILIGLLYGEGDFIDSMVIAMQCGQDSDCNPSSVGGILGTYYGFDGIPASCVRNLDEDGTRFSATTLSFRQTVDACYKLMNDSLSEYAVAEEDGYRIAVRKIAAVPFEQWPDMPAVEFQAAVRADGSVALRMNAVDKSGVRSIRLDMGDGAVFYDALSSYKYEKAGLYTIALTVTNNNGGIFEKTVEVQTDRDFPAAAENRGEYRNLAPAGYPLCSVTAPDGSGSRDPESIRDGIKPQTGVWAPEQQYDTYLNNPLPHDEYVGYVFREDCTLDTLVFTEGMHFDNGGYFAGGSPEVQVLVADGDAFVWQRVDAAVSPAYPVGDAADAFGAHFESYTFAFASIRCRGVRLLGHAGGDAHFISVAELEAYGAES